MGDVSRDDIGAIRIQQDASLIELREGAVAGFLAAIGPAMTLEGGAALTRLDSPPSFDRAARPERPARPKDHAPRPEKPATMKERAPRPDKPFAPKDHAPRPETPVTAKERAPRPAEAHIPAPTPKAKARTPGTTTPIDWNDSSQPRVKKPKGGAKPAYKAKPRHAAAKPGAAGDGEVWQPLKSGAAKPKRTGGPDSRPKGPKPPAGKPSSKKNRARLSLAGKPAGSGPSPRKPRKPQG
jgi:ATP-dependent RNA helicase DeaD